MTSEEMFRLYPNCVGAEYVYLDGEGNPQLKDRKFGESMTYEECLAFELKYNCSMRRGSIKLENAEDFLARGRK